MSLLGCEWESIERHEKLRGVVSEVGGGRGARESSPPLRLTPPAVMTGRKRLVGRAPSSELHILATTYQRQCSKEVI